MAVIVELVHPEVVLTIAAYLDFCYIARQTSFDVASLKALDNALERFCKHRAIFVKTGVCPDGISLPRQHSIQHYCWLIKQFGAPYGLSSSLTESAHISAVKEPWRHSSHFEELLQILVTNQRMDNLAAFHSKLFAAGLLNAPLVPEGTQVIAMDSDDDNIAEIGNKRIEAIVQFANSSVSHYPRYLEELVTSDKVTIPPEFPDLVRKFLYYQQNPDAPAGHSVDISLCPPYHGKIYVFHSASATFYAPHSDLGHRGQPTHQIIHCTPKWRGGPACHDCVFVENDLDLPGFKGLYVGQVLLLFSLKARGWSQNVPCALIQWFTAVGDQPCDLTGMWMVEPEYDSNNQRVMSVVHLDCILRPAHLIPIYGHQHVPHDLPASESLNAFNGYYVNKYSDYHAYRLAF